MDPRMRGRNPDYGKRPASRSPEGSTSRKLSKTSPREGSSTPNAFDAVNSRRSSDSTTTAQGRTKQPLSGIGVKPFSHNPGTQKENGPAYVAPPDSLSSRRGRPEEVPSGQSTPRSANGTGVVRQDFTLGNLTTNAVSLEPGPDHFMKCMRQNTELSKLSNAVDQAEARVKRAEAEYQNMSKHFRDFPVIKEQKTQALTDARQALETTRSVYEKQSSVQRQLAEGMVKFLQSTKVKPDRDTAKDTITVPIEDFRQLCARVSKIESEPRNTAALSNHTQTRERVTTLEARFMAGSSPEETQRLWSGIESLRVKIEAHEVEMQKLKSETKAGSGASQAASQTVRSLGAKVSSDLGQLTAIRRDIDKLKQTTERHENGTQLNRWAPQSSSKAAPREENDGKQSIEKLSGDVSAFAKQLADCQRSQDSLNRRLFHTPGDAEDNSISSKLHVAKDQITTLSKQMQEVQGKMREEEKQLVAKRLTEHERRFDKVEGDGKKLEAEVIGLRDTFSARSGTATAPTNSSADPESTQAFTAMLEPIKAQLQQLKADNAHRDEMREQDDDLIINNVFDTSERQLAEQKQWVENEMATLKDQIDRNRETDSNRTTRSLTELATSTSDTLKAIKSDAEDMKKSHAALNSKVNDLDVLRRDISEIRRQTGELTLKMAGKVEDQQFKVLQETYSKRLDDFKKSLTELQASISDSNSRQQNTRLTNGTATPAATGFQPPPMRPPQVNGISKINSTATPTPNAPTDQKLQEMSQKVEALTYAFQMFKRQYDNITSDQMVDRMLEQFGSVWPHAKNYNIAIAEVNRMVSQLEARVGQAEASVVKVAQDVKGVGEARQELGQAREEIRGLKVQMQNLMERFAGQEGQLEVIEEFFQVGNRGK